jgi:hypothetical protein
VVSLRPQFPRTYEAVKIHCEFYGSAFFLPDLHVGGEPKETGMEENENNYGLNIFST